MDRQHDRQYKWLFSHPVFFTKLLQSFVREKFVQDLDFSTLERVDKEFISPEYAERESDIIWKINYKGRPVYIFTLLEFQSTMDKTMPLRFLRYICEFYQCYHGATVSGKLPAVFPLLLYNGEGKWTAPERIEYLIEESVPDRFIPSFGYYSIIENTFSKDVLRKIKNAVSAVFYVENSTPEELEAEIDVLIGLIKEEALEVVAHFSTWINNFLAGEEERQRAVVEKSINDVMEVKTMFATKLEEYGKRLKTEGIAEGKAKGIIEGKAKGIVEGKKATARKMLRKGFAVDVIADITGLSADEIKNLT